jgi:DNA-binding transcriptional regulator YiaG
MTREIRYHGMRYFCQRFVYHTAMLAHMKTAETEVLAIAQVRVDAARGRARDIRERAQLSLSEMARAVGVHTTTVAGWESGRRVPRGAAAARYADLLWKLDQISRSDEVDLGRVPQEVPCDDAG